MKIYTITCHNAYNYGAVLQALALQEYLEELHHDVKVIDYYPSYLRRISERYRNNYMLILARKVLYFPDYNKSKKVFEQFKRKYLKVTDVCNSLEDIERLPEVDLYIAGSDQIWNPIMENGRDDCYFLNLEKPIRKMSYAASVGLRNIEPDIEVRYKKMLGKFDKILVRETETVSLLEKMGIYSQQVLDPVYLMPKNYWENLMCEEHLKEKYIIVYALHHIQDIYDYAKCLAKELGIKMYVISVEMKEKRRGGDKFFWNPSVEKFLTLIANSEGVVSNSFHGISFANIFQKPVHIFDTEKGDIRISNIVELFQLENRVCKLNQEKCLVNSFEVETALKIEEEIKKTKCTFNQSLIEIEGEV